MIMDAAIRSVLILLPKKKPFYGSLDLQLENKIFPIPRARETGFTNYKRLQQYRAIAH